MKLSALQHSLSLDGFLSNAARYPGITYWTYNWRKQGGAERMVQISKREQFYMQEYCGCAYSRRDTDRWRLANGRERIRLGEKYYGQDRNES
jgi:epoxyqueuosine reductase